MRQPSFGILAGMGQRSTAPFHDLVVTECQRQYGARDDIDFPRMTILSQPAPFYEDRPTDHAALEAAILDGLRHLERTGADFLAIACNTAHIYYPRLAASVGVPLLNMVELAVADVPMSARRPALVAARPTVEAGIYQTALRGRGFEPADSEWQAQTDHLLGATRATTDPAVFAQLWSELLGRVRASGADAVLVACLDLSGVLAHAVAELPVVDAAVSLAREIVRQWLLRRDAAVTVERDEYVISTDSARLDLAAVHAYLSSSYWSPGVPAEVVARAAHGSLCFGLYHRGAQVGYARVVTDSATFAYLCDVYVLEEHRGRGLGRWLMEVVMAHPALRGLRRFVLVTRDAHGLYERLGFRPLARPDGYMEIHRPDVYAEAGS